MSFRLTASIIVTGSAGSSVSDSAGTPSLIENGAIDVDDAGMITAVGVESELGSAPGETIVRSGLLMPGLVNSHAHTPMTLVRSAGDGLPLREWLADGVWPRELQMTTDDARVGMRLGAAEMLLGGVTSTCEMYLHEEAVVDACVEAGLRLVVTPGVIAALAPDGKLDGRLDEIRTFHQRHHRPDEGVSVGFGPHSLYDLAPEQVSEIGTLAADLDALVHIHLDETRSEREEILERGTGSATQQLHDLGLLEGRLLGAHGVWLSDEDMAILGRAERTAIAHCPQSNLKLGSGIARVADMLAADITVGVATDGPASNDDLDMWDEMRLTALLARGSAHDPQAISAHRALHLATKGSATAIGLDDVGVLQPGHRADIIHVDTDQPAFVPGLIEDFITHLVFAGSKQFVTDVWVGGRQQVSDGSLVHIDLEAAVTDARLVGQRLAT